MVDEARSIEWNIVPFEGVGPLRFGMSRQQVQDILHTAPHSFRKTVDAPSLTDAYDQFSLHAYFDSDDELEELEFFEPGELVFLGIKGALAGTLRESTEVLRDTNSILFHHLHDQVVSTSLGISIWADDGEVRAVSIFRRDVVDSYLGLPGLRREGDAGS